MNKKDSKSSKEEQNKVEEPKVACKSNSVSENETELNPLLIQLLEKSKNQFERGEYISYDEMKKRIKLKYPFLK